MPTPKLSEPMKRALREGASHPSGHLYASSNEPLPRTLKALHHYGLVEPRLGYGGFRVGWRLTDTGRALAEKLEEEAHAASR